MPVEIIIALLNFATRFGLDAAIVFAERAGKANTLDDAIAALKGARDKTAEDYLAEARAKLPPTLPASNSPA